MYQLNLPTRWQNMLRSTIYSLLIPSMLWVLWPADVSASTLAAEEPSSTFICQVKRLAIVCTDPETKAKITIPQQRGKAEIEVAAISIEGEPTLSSVDTVPELVSNKSGRGRCILNPSECPSPIPLGGGKLKP